MKVIYKSAEYTSYDDAVTAMGGESNVPAGLPSKAIKVWEIFRDGADNPTLIGYSSTGSVMGYWHAYYDAVQEMWRWQL